IDRPPRDATVAPSASGLNTVPAQAGLTVYNVRLARRIEHALAVPGASRTVSGPAHKVKPQVTTSELASKYPAYIVVNRGEFRLRFYHHFHLSNPYKIAECMK